MARRREAEKMTNWRRERDLLRAERERRAAHEARLRDLVRDYVRAGRAWHGPQRTALEAALKAEGPRGVDYAGWIWAWSGAEGSIVRARATRGPHEPARVPARLPRVYRSGLAADGRPDLMEMSPEVVEG